MDVTTVERVMLGVGLLLVLAALVVGAGVARELWQMAFDTLQVVKP